MVRPEPWLAIFLLLTPLVLGVFEWFKSRRESSAMAHRREPVERTARHPERGTL
jgi:hypothetical protein